MATGDQFISALKSAVSPATIAPGRSTSDEAVFNISDGRVVRIKRREVKDADDSGIEAIVQKAIGNV
jgi:hypothetical protein